MSDDLFSLYRDVLKRYPGMPIKICKKGKENIYIGIFGWNYLLMPIKR